MLFPEEGLDNAGWEFDDQLGFRLPVRGNSCSEAPCPWEGKDGLKNRMERVRGRLTHVSMPLGAKLYKNDLGGDRNPHPGQGLHGG